MNNEDTLPDVFFGEAQRKPIDWRKVKNLLNDVDDDSELLFTPPSVVELLGFDPKEAE